MLCVIDICRNLGTKYCFPDDEFKVGLDLDLSIDVKPRSLSGVILSVVKPGGDYLVLEMDDGKVKHTSQTVFLTHCPQDVLWESLN